MSNPILQKLSMVRRRQRAVGTLAAALRGVAIGSIFVVAVEVLRRSLGWWHAPWPSLALFFVSPLAGAVVGSLLRRPMRGAAGAVDRTCALKDRTVTALEFLGDDKRSAVQHLAVRDAESHMGVVDARAVVPVRVQRPARWACAGALAAIVAIALPGATPEIQAAISPPIPGIFAEAEKLADDFEKFDQLVKQQEDRSLEELTKELEQLAEQMKQPGVDVTDALMKLSQMEAAIMRRQAQYSVAAADQQVAALGAAMNAFASMEQIGSALSRGDLDDAAQKLDQFEPSNMEPKEREDAEQRLREIAKAMRDSGLGSMSAATSGFAESLSGGGSGGIGAAGGRLAKQLRNHKKRKGIDQWMMQQLARLSECKSSCRSCDKSGACKLCGSSSCSGTGGGPCNSGALSQNPSTRWGTGVSGNPAGDPTQLDANRSVEHITGKQGKGPVDTETTLALEGRQQASRTYKQAYSDYKKLSEAVLDAEPIPLGHRQTIRRYFESIRPTNAEAAESTAVDGAGSTR